MAGPQKLTSAFIPLGTPALTDFIFAPTNAGSAKKYTLDTLKNFILDGGSSAVKVYANITDMLANTTLASGFFAFVVDSSDGTPDYNGWSLWAYFGGERSLIASYVLIAYEELISSDTRYIETTDSALIVTPVKGTNNNYEWTVSGNYTLTWDFTDVPDGASGIIEIIKDATATPRYIALPANSSINEDDYSEEPDVDTSDIAVSTVADNGSGLIRITTGAAHGLTTGQRVLVSSVLGTVESNGKWTVTVIDSTNIDLDDSTFVNTYTSDGTVRKLANYLAIQQEASALTILAFYNRNGRMRINLRRGYFNV